MPTPTSPPPKRPAKKDPLCHGFYSRWFTPDEIDRLDRDILGDFRDEENQLIVIIDRLLAEMKNSENRTADDYRITSRTVSQALESIATIRRLRESRSKKTAAFFHSKEFFHD
jgi:hypothetical protein